MAADGERSVERALAIVPCLNERAHIDRVIDSLLDDVAWTDPLVVVADGGSQDGTIELVAARCASDRRIRLVRNARKLQSAGVNLAARLYGEGRTWLVRADAHSDYPRGFVSRLIAEAGRVGPVVAVAVRLKAVGRTSFQKAVAAAQNTRLGTGGSLHRTGGRAEGFIDHGHHGLIDLGAFTAAGGYDESFTHNEDAELDARLRRGGGRIWLTRNIEVGYFPRSSIRGLFRQYFSYGRGRARTTLRHRLKPRLRQLAPLAVAPALILLALSPIWPLAAAPAGAWAVACCLYGAVLAITAASPCVLMSGPVAMVMHAAWSLGFWSQLLGAGGKRKSAPIDEALNER
jgi:succinoglycan biosynthesis protein ExoA